MMQVVSKMLTTFRKVIGFQVVDSESEYRMSQYCLELFAGAGTQNKLCYNMLTGEMILMDSGEKTEREYLIQHWFFVKREVNEQALFRQFRQLMNYAKKPSETTSYTILTTTGCNARCFYCYEKGRTLVTMTEERAHEVADFILRNRQSDKVKIMWFGGEPLYNGAVIDTICDDLKDKGVNLRSTIITNGYLATAELIAKMKTNWNLEQVQISLDGTETVYNRAKNYIYPGVNAFRTVIDHIEEFLKVGIIVKVRLNMERYNQPDLMELCRLLYDRFGTYENLYVYPAILFEPSEQAIFKRNELDEKEVFEAYKELQEEIDRLGFGVQDGILEGVKVQHCMADNDYALVIAPDGKLTKCEHFSDCEIIGSIDEGVTNTELVQEWKTPTAEVEACKTCKVYPLCRKLQKCPDEKKDCSAVDRELLEYKIKRKMKNTYRKWCETQKEEEK